MKSCVILLSLQQMTMDETFEFFRGLADICYKKFPVDMKVLTDVNEGRFADDAENLMVSWNETLAVFVCCDSSK